jgi:hypothetical protein
VSNSSARHNQPLAAEKSMAERSCVKISVATGYKTDVQRAINRRTGCIVHHHAFGMLLVEAVIFTFCGTAVASALWLGCGVKILCATDRPTRTLAATS